jgi:hypothetical protein
MLMWKEIKKILKKWIFALTPLRVWLKMPRLDRLRHLTGSTLRYEIFAGR